MAPKANFRWQALPGVILALLVTGAMADQDARTIIGPRNPELQRGAERARALSAPYLAEIRDAIGIRRLG